MLLLLVIDEPQRKDLFILDAVYIDRYMFNRSNLEMSLDIIGNSISVKFNTVM